MILSSIQIADRSSPDKISEYYNERILLKHNNKAFSILLHTIKVDDNLISGYSKKYDSIMVFLYPKQNISNIKSKIRANSVDVHNCTVCHSY